MTPTGRASRDPLTDPPYRCGRRLHLPALPQAWLRPKVFKEMLRPVFTLLDRGPLSNACTFVSYESFDAISELKHLAHTSETVFADFEERADAELL
jgi:hypothetical protein